MSSRNELPPITSPMSFHESMLMAKALMVPPYRPISSTTSFTLGSSGSRSSTGGNSPAATSSASIGASLYLPVLMVAVVEADSSSVPPATANAATSSESTTLSASDFLTISYSFWPLMHGLADMVRIVEPPRPAVKSVKDARSDGVSAG